MSRWRTLSARRAAWAFGLAAALLCAQALGLAHRVWHAPGVHAVQADASGHAAGDADCRLLDALAAADLLAGAAMAPPAVVPPAPPRLARVATGRGAVAFAPYLARAPPQG